MNYKSVSALLFLLAFPLAAQPLTVGSFSGSGSGLMGQILTSTTIINTNAIYFPADFTRGDLFFRDAVYVRTSPTNYAEAQGNVLHLAPTRCWIDVEPAPPKYTNDNPNPLLGTWRLVATGDAVGGDGPSYASTALFGTDDLSLLGQSAILSDTIYVGEKVDCSKFTIPNNGYVKFYGINESNVPSGGADEAFIFAATNSGIGVIYHVDGAGNVTGTSPHDWDVPSGFIDNNDEMPMITKEVNRYTGTARWINHSRAARRTEQLENAVQVLISLVNTNGMTSTQIKRLNAISDLSSNDKNIVQVTTNYVPPTSWTSYHLARYATTYTNTLKKYLATIAAGKSNAVAPVWSPTVPTIPTQLQLRGVQ